MAPIKIGFALTSSTLIWDDSKFLIRNEILRFSKNGFKKNRKPYDPGGDGVSGGTTIF